MANERITENIFRKRIFQDELYKSEKILLEEQKSKNIKIDKLLTNASKKGNGKGYPEFIITFKENPDFIIVVECKSDITKHNSKEGNKFGDYAVDGVKLYASFLSKEYDVLAIAISGEDESTINVSHFIQLKGTNEIYINEDLNDNHIYKLQEYLNVYLKDDKKFNQDYHKLLDYSKQLNEKLQSLKIPEADRSLLISGSLIALTDIAFLKSYKFQNPKDLANNIINTVRSRFEPLQKENIEEIILSYNFVKTHPILSKEENQLRDIISEIDEKINSFMRTHKYFDTLGQFYIEFLKYANSDKGLGIVLTPPHITELFVDLAKVNSNSVVFDNCTGTGGFLISSMDRMIKDAGGDEEKELEIKKKRLIGIEFSDKIFPLVCSNMYIHGDGRSNLIHGSCFNKVNMDKAKHFKPNVGFLNPPYKSTKEEPEEFEFILNNLECLEKGAICIAIVPMSSALTVKGKNYELKKQLLFNHTLEGVLTMPLELFKNSKVSVSTCIMIIKAKEKHPENYKTFFASCIDDGFIKRKINGRADYNNNWAKVKKRWLNLYNNKEEIPGFSIKKIISANDEWCAEAYMDTNYSSLTISMFEDKIRDYLMFLFKYGKIKHIEESKSCNETIKFDVSTWKEFNLEDLFIVTGSKSIDKTGIKEYESGLYPFVVTSSVNNGVEGLYNYSTEKGNVLTIDSATVGSIFYQPFDFSASDHVEKLIPKFEKFNVNHAMFIITVLGLEQIRYNFGRKFAQMRIKKTIIKLPVDKKGNPDYLYMEKFIKTLPYSSNLF